MPSKRKPFIRASDIGSYVYCRRAWWLRRVGGFEPEDLEGRLQRGTLAHNKHGRKVRRSRLQLRAALICLVLGGLLLAVAIALLFL
jgi:CRISPR/Cas system-associated exonuclease Cas4 (RecB family)